MPLEKPDKPGSIEAPAAQERLIVPLDFAGEGEAFDLVEKLADTVSFYKVGLELFVAAGPGVVRRLIRCGKRVFLDLKINDIDETIRRATAQVAQLEVDLLTLFGNEAVSRAAVEGRGEKRGLKLLAVTVLTSTNDQDLREAGLLGHSSARFGTLEDYVEWRAEQALESGCDGLISSGLNVRRLRAKFANRTPRPLIVCPGIRLAGAATHDQKRPATPYDAIRDGADYLVVGRPITRSTDPVGAAKAVIEEIARGLAART